MPRLQNPQRHTLENKIKVFVDRFKSSTLGTPSYLINVSVQYSEGCNILQEYGKTYKAYATYAHRDWTNTAV